MKPARRMEKKFIILFASGAVLLLLGIAGLLLLPPLESGVEDEQASVIPVEVSYPAPEIKLLSIDGREVSLADYRGQFVMVNNWATWCPPCKAEMPDLNAYYLQHKDDNFTLIGIEAGDTSTNVSAVIEQLKIEYPIWLDPGEEALYAFQTTYLPSTFVVDPEGTVRMQWTGMISLKTLEKYVTPLLEN